MRLTLLLCAALIAAPGVAAQDTGTAPVALPLHGPRPADVVAQLAREAMGSPSDAESWKALAGALPELALMGGADLEGTFEAARLADSLSALEEAGAVATSVTGDGTGDEIVTVLMQAGADVLEVARRPEVAGSAMAALIAALLLWSAVARRKARPVKRTATAPRPKGRLWTARALARGGAHIAEIAEQTGMAQEAVGLTLRLAGVGAVSAWEEELPHRERRQPLNSPVQTLLEQDVLSGSSRLRDRVLTYGGVTR